MPPTTPSTLLLVDDEDNILSSLRRLLRGEGYRILTCNDPVKALDLITAEALRGEPVDVILSDQRMPTMSGTEFLRQVKDRHPETVRLVLSGYTDLQSVTDAINEGAIYKFLTKPWEDEHLKANLREAFLRKAMGDENQRLAVQLAESNARLFAANEELRRMVDDKDHQNRLVERALDTNQEIIQLIPWPIVGIDETGMIALANSAAENQFSAGETLLGMPAAEFLPADLAEGLKDPPGLPDTTLLNNCQYQVVCRTMGMHSHSQGKLLALLPKEALT